MITDPALRHVRRSPGREILDQVDRLQLASAYTQEQYGGRGRRVRRTAGNDHNGVWPGDPGQEGDSA